MTKAYRFRAKIYHNHCIAPAAHSRLYEGALLESLSAEKYLNRAAKFKKVDRKDEGSFSSNDFPKKIRARDINDTMICGHCRRPILEQ